jgi:hypothetical protein
MGTGDGEEQDLRNERIGDPFILGILLWLRGEIAEYKGRAGFTE